MANESQLGGTRSYEAPEVTTKGWTAGQEKGDSYSLGVTLFCMARGIPPYNGDNPYDPYKQMVLQEKWDLFWTAH